MIKHQPVTKAIPNLGNILILKFIALNEISGKLKISFFKILALQHSQAVMSKLRKQIEDDKFATRKY